MSTGRLLAVVDIDGVVADVRHRLHHLQGRKDWDAFFAAAAEDAVHPEGAAIVSALSPKYDIVFLTGRPERLRVATQRWLDGHGFDGHELVMRPEGDRRPAAIVKVERLAELAERQTIAIVVDDDPQVLGAAHAAGHQTFTADWERKPPGPESALHRAQEVDGRT